MVNLILSPTLWSYMFYLRFTKVFKICDFDFELYKESH